MNKDKLIPWRKRKEDELVRREGDYPFVALQRQINSLFDDLFEGLPAPRWPRFGDVEQGLASISPDVDISETDDEIQVAADLPGLEEKDLQVSLDNNMLTIRGEKKQEREEKKRNYHVVERSYGEFHRVIPVPDNVDREKIKAALKKGVLKVTLPKTPEAKSSARQIEINGE